MSILYVICFQLRPYEFILFTYLVASFNEILMRSNYSKIYIIHQKHTFLTFSFNPTFVEKYDEEII